jgi:hypothetical protein
LDVGGTHGIVITSMSKPTDHVQGEDLPPGQQQRIRKVPMLDPGFREDPGISVLRPRILGIHVPSNREDRKNVKLVIIAALVSLFIFAALEYKQLHEAAREAEHSLMGHFK